MGKARSPNRDKAYELWAGSGGGRALRSIAAELDVPEKTVSAWKAKDKWEQRRSGVRQSPQRSTPMERSTPKEKACVPQPFPEEALERPGNLTEKQALFCLYYIRCFNATKAAVKAGYSAASAHSIGWELLQKPEIRAEIMRLKQQRLNRELLHEDDIVQQYIDIAFADLGDYVVWNGHGTALNPSAEVDSALVREIKETKDGISIKLHDKLRALDWLAGHMDLLDTVTRVKLEAERQKNTRPEAEAPLDLRQFTDEELRNLARIGEPDAGGGAPDSGAGPPGTGEAQPD